MAVTAVADVVIPEVYDDYFMENSIYKSAFYRSGIIATNPMFDTMLDGGAEQFELPFWQSNDVIGATASAVDEGTTLTPGSLTATKMTARRQFREKAWGQQDMAAVFAGSAPINGMIDKTEEFWNRNYQVVLFKSIQGAITDNVDNDGGDMVNDITEDGVTAINSDAVIETKALFGDQTENATAIAMSSVPYSELQKSNLIDFRPDNEQNVGWGTYLGMSVIVDDTLVVSSTYWTVLFKPQAFAYGSSVMRYVPTEVDRNPAISGGQSLYYTRRVYLIHPYGFAWSDDGAMTTDSPTDAELIKAANWDRVAASVKNTGFVVLKTLS